MVTYKASDLIQAALDLADLNNTSFPTARENRLAINIAWQKIYQQAIDIGCTFWIKSTTISEGENDLPEDFFQLDYVEDKNHNQIDRFQKGRSRGRFYSIIRGKILLKNCDEATIWYNPVPNTLDITGTGDIELEYPNTILYTLMIYEVAKYYKIKQHADYSGIQDLYDNAWTLFYDMIQRDNNQDIVIKDVYQGNNYYDFRL